MQQQVAPTKRTTLLTQWSLTAPPPPERSQTSLQDQHQTNTMGSKVHCPITNNRTATDVRIQGEEQLVIHYYPSPLILHPLAAGSCDGDGGGHSGKVTSSQGWHTDIHMCMHRITPTDYGKKTEPQKGPTQKGPGLVGNQTWEHLLITHFKI